MSDIVKPGFRVITGERGTGKTLKLIQESAKTGAYIVCSHRHLAEWTSQKAKDWGYKIPFPITFDEFLRDSFGRGLRQPIHLLIDDAHLLLYQLTRDNVVIDTITVNTVDERYEHLTMPEVLNG